MSKSFYFFLIYYYFICDDDMLLQVARVRQWGEVPAGEVMEAAEGEGEENIYF